MCGITSGIIFLVLLHGFLTNYLPFQETKPHQLTLCCIDILNVALYESAIIHNFSDIYSVSCLYTIFFIFSHHLYFHLRLSVCTTPVNSIKTVYDLGLAFTGLFTQSSTPFHVMLSSCQLPSLSLQGWSVFSTTKLTKGHLAVANMDV